MRLRYIFIVLFCMIALTPVAVFWAWPHSRALQNEIDGVQGRHLLLAHNLRAALSRYQRDVRSVFSLISVNLIKDVPITDYTDVLKGLSFRHICIFKYPSGELATQASIPHMGCPSALPDARRAQFEGLELSETAQFSEVAEGPNGDPVLFVVRTIGDYLAVGAITTEYFVSLGRSIVFGEKGHAAIVDHAGNILAHPLDDWIHARRNLADISAVRKMMNGETGVEVFYAPALGEDVIAGFSAVPDVNWGVMVPQPIAELKAKARSIKNVAMWIVGSGALLAAVLAWLASVHLSRPLERFTAAAQRVGAGDLSPDFDIGHQVVVPKEINTARTALSEMTSQLRGNADAMSRLAYVDNLTSLPNRQRFRELASAALSDAAFSDEPVTLLFCDLNGFKSINDTYGHRAGDEVLKEFSFRLEQFVAQHDTSTSMDPDQRRFVPGRLGGDEFAVLFKGLQPYDVVPLAKSLLNEINQPFELYQNHVARISASMGLAGFKQHGEDLNVLLRSADAAMYYAKRTANIEIAIYDPKLMDSSASAPVTLAVEQVSSMMN